jgi:hypothetical protein
MVKPAGEASKVIARALEQFEEISVDSKLNELEKLLSRLTTTKTGYGRICVLTDYVATLFDLSAELEDRSMNCLLLYGAMSAEDRHRSLMSFANGKGILLACRVTLPLIQAFVSLLPVRACGLKALLSMYRRDTRAGHLVAQEKRRRGTLRSVHVSTNWTLSTHGNFFVARSPSLVVGWPVENFVGLLRRQICNSIVGQSAAA